MKWRMLHKQGAKITYSKPSSEAKKQLFPLNDSEPTVLLRLVIQSNDIKSSFEKAWVFLKFLTKGLWI